MRHRSNIAFIVLAAALFAAPQMAHDLSALKGAVAARIRGEILQTFLGLHANEAAAAAKQAPRADLSLVAVKAEKTEAQGATKKGGERSSCPSQRNDARAQTAMLTDPADKTSAGLPPAAVAVELASLPRQARTEIRRAMLTPPSSNGVEPPPTRAVYEYKTGDAFDAREKFAELERQGVFIQTRFDFEHGAENAKWLRRVAADAARAAGSEGAKGRARVIKIRRQGKACGGDAAPCTFVSLPVATLAKPEAATLISDGE
jgi:hypothetical protein